MEVTMLREYCVSPNIAIKSTFPLCEASTYECLVHNSFSLFHAVANHNSHVFVFPSRQINTLC